jgi:hypothetical protein
MAKTVHLVIEVEYTLENERLEELNTNRLLQQMPHVLEDARGAAPTGVRSGSTKVRILREKPKS